MPSSLASKAARIIRFAVAGSVGQASTRRARAVRWPRPPWKCGQFTPKMAGLRRPLPAGRGRFYCDDNPKAQHGGLAGSCGQVENFAFHRVSEIFAPNHSTTCHSRLGSPPAVQLSLRTWLQAAVLQILQPLGHGARFAELVLLGHGDLDALRKLLFLFHKLRKVGTGCTGSAPASFGNIGRPSAPPACSPPSREP
jgi:hypothetical protein